MLRILVAKELKTNLLSLRFWIASLFVLTVFLASSVIFCKKFSNELDEYSRNQETYRKSLHVGTSGLDSFFSEAIVVTKRPRIGSMIAEGRESRYPKSMVLQLNAPQAALFSGGMKFGAQVHNYKLPRSIGLDWVFVIGVVMSFLAIVLSFDAVSQEREEGTLRLQVSFPVQRLQILFGKYLAILALLCSTMGLGVVIGVAVTWAILNQNLLFVLPVQAGAVVVLSMIYLSLFIWLSFWVSSTAKKSSTSLALLMLIWVFVIILVPYLGGMLVERYQPVRSLAQLDKELQGQFGTTFERYAPPEYHDLYRDREPESGSNAINAFLDRLNDTYEKLIEGRFAELLDQAALSERFNSVSPFASFRYASECLSGTGLQYHRQFFRNTRIYRNELMDFVRQKDMKDPQSKHRLTSVRRVKSMSQQPLDPEEIPRFMDPKMSISDAIDDGLTCIIYLFMLNVLCICMAVVSFSKMDAR